MRLSVWWLLIIYKSGWWTEGISICIPPNEPACGVPGHRYLGPTIKDPILVTSIDSCYVLCLWDADCAGFTSKQSEVATSCSLLSEVTSCVIDGNSGYSSAANCFADKRGELHRWEVLPEKSPIRTVDGKFAVMAGDTLTLSCSVSGLDRIFSFEEPVRWYKRNKLSPDRSMLPSITKKIALDPVKNTDSGLYSCELDLFSDITIGSPEFEINVVFLESGFQQVPTRQTYTRGAEYIILPCKPPLSSPPAVIDWHFGNPSANARISQLPDLSYIIIDGSLVIFSPTKATTDGNFFCSARNTLLDDERTTNPVNIREEFVESSDERIGKTAVLVSPPKNFGQLQSMVKEIGSSVTALFGKILDQNQEGVWLEEENVFRCILLENIGEKIVWTLADEDVLYSDENNDLHFMEGDQILMLSPAKIESLQSDSKKVSCKNSKTNQVTDILLPLKGTDIPTETVMLKQVLDIDALLEKVRELLSEVQIQGTTMLIGSIPSPHLQLTDLDFQYIAINGDPCRSYTYSSLQADIEFESKKLGTEHFEGCPSGGSVIGSCKMVSPGQQTGWVISLTEECTLNRITAPSLLSFLPVDATSGIITTGSTRNIEFTTVLGALEGDEEYYSQSSELVNAVLKTVSAVETAAGVSLTTKIRAALLRKIYLGYMPVTKEGYVLFGDSTMSTILWEPEFPLTEDVSLAYAQNEGEEPELVLSLPMHLSVRMESGVQPFFLSLYHKPDSFTANIDKSSSYSSKVIDIEPPSTISNLTSKQSIKLALAIGSDALSSDSPKCYWYDIQAEVWREDGITTLGYNEDGLFECLTSHLTGFSILVSTQPLEGIHGDILSYVTYVCGGLSCCAMLLTLIALVPFREIRRSHSIKIHICLVFTLLLATLLFLIGSERTENYLICEIIAITSHYLWLTVFAWTVVEAYNLYLLFIRILNSHSSKFIFKLAIPTLTVPACIVGVTTGLSYDSYSHHEYCLLGGDVVYYAFVCPVVAVFVVNGSIFIAVIIKIFKKGRYQNYKGKVEKTLSQMKALSTLSCVLGLTCVFGFFTFKHEGNVVFHYLFSVLHVTQGLVIFVCHCVIKPDVRQKWLYVLCNVGNDLKGGSRSTTPTKSRLNLLSGMFQKRNSTSTLSTTISKLSLTKQLTRPRADSNGSFNFGLLGFGKAEGGSRRLSLAPLKEKDSGAADTPVEKNPLHPMISSHSGDGDLGTIVPLTPPGSSENKFNVLKNGKVTPTKRGKISPSFTKMILPKSPKKMILPAADITPSRRSISPFLGNIKYRNTGSSESQVRNALDMFADHIERADFGIDISDRTAIENTKKSRAADDNKRSKDIDEYYFADARLEERMDGRPNSSRSEGGGGLGWRGRRRISPNPPTDGQFTPYSSDDMSVTARLAQLEEWMM